MKKNILIAFLTISTILFFFYAYIKADESNRARIKAEEVQATAETLRAKSEEFQKRAADAAAEAQLQAELAKKALAECEQN